MLSLKTIGFDQFIDLFGNITILDIANFILAVVFIVLLYIKTKKIIIQHYEEKKQKDEQLREAVLGVRKYPEYRKQSIEIQKQLTAEIREVKEAQGKINDKLTNMEEVNKRRERNKLRDRLLQNYRYYTSTDTNPKQSWTKMESEAFWELFRDYEDADGDGYVHTEVQPAMEKLHIINHD